MAGSDSIAWDLGNAPKQSITEVLQNPRGPTLELPEFDLSAATALALSSPTPTTHLPEPLDINHFEDFLRQYAPLHQQFNCEKERIDAAAVAESESALAPSPQPAGTKEHDVSAVPHIYFDDHFSVANNRQLAALQHTSSQTPSVPLPPGEVTALRKTLSTYRTSLELQMRDRLSAQSASISSALANVRTLRAELLATASAIRTARTQAATLVPAVAGGLRAARAVSAVQMNVRALREAVASVQLVLRAPDDVAVLLQTGEYAAAIHAVHAAKEALSHRHLASVLAFAPARARLARAVEAIDAALRDEFRAALRAGKSQEATLREVVSLVAVMGRLPLLRGFFLKEIKAELAKELKVVDGLHAACREVKASAERALMLITIIDMTGDPDDVEQGKVKPYLREVHDDLEEMLASAVDRFLGSFSVSSETGPGAGFVVMTDMDSLSEVTCFDEFKAALRFGVEVRSLEEVAKELESMFSSEKKSSSLRAKISERHIAFLSAFHKAHVETLTQTVKADKWQEVRVPRGAVRLLAAVMVDGSESANTDMYQNGIAAETDENGTAQPEQFDLTDGAVVIGGDVFKTVASGVRYLRSMCAYTLLAEKSPRLAPEIARRATELSRLFNSLIGKAILGAAALQWSGLRSITARHLSLASRTVAMAAALADHIDKPLEKALSTSQVGVILPLIQRSEKDLREHHGQLLAKILAIMMDRLEAHEGVLKSLPWDKAQEMKRFDMPSAYVATLVKEATVLHRILWSILPTTEVCDIFQRVCAAYGTHLTEAYSSLDGGKRWIRSRVAEDVICLHDRLLVLDVFNANPDAFKPVSKLYIRFAKDVKEADTKADDTRGKVGRIFIRRQDNEAELQSSREAATANEADGNEFERELKEVVTSPGQQPDETVKSEKSLADVSPEVQVSLTDDRPEAAATSERDESSAVHAKATFLEKEQSDSSHVAEGRHNGDSSEMLPQTDHGSMSAQEIADNGTVVNQTGGETGPDSRDLEQGLNEILGIGTEKGHEEGNGMQTTDNALQPTSVIGPELENGTMKDAMKDAEAVEVPEGDVLGLGSNLLSHRAV